MPRSRIRQLGRWVTACQAVLLLLLQLAGGTGMHRCPVHDRMAGMPAADPAPEHEHHSHGSQGPSVCHCLGACAAPLAMFLPARVPALPVPAVVTARAECRLAPALHTAPRLLPFALGPPPPT